jgi:photosystem II stability/assembly factor-like uncharacterized protein
MRGKRPVHRRSFWFVPLALSTCALAQSFTVQTSNTHEDLRGLSAVSASIIWASGTHGTYLRTVDGGLIWTVGQVAGAETLDFRDVEAFSAEEAYLLAAGPGEQSRIYKTSDGGKSWVLQFTNQEPKGFYDCMAFWDRDHGIALGDAIDGVFEITETGDGGAHWNPIPEPLRPHSLAEEGAFAASGTCIMAKADNLLWFVTGGNAARVFRSSNRGNTWSAADVPITHQGASAGIFSIAVGSPSYVVVGGGDYKQAEKEGSTLAYSEDGGITWRAFEIRPQFYFSAVALDPANSRHLLAVGSARAVYSDDIENRAWRASWEMNLNAATFTAPGQALAVGPKGKVVRFTLPR